MMAGCIPVFIGPPYASMPLGKYVDYDAAAMVFQALDYTEWLPRPLIKAFLSQSTARRLAPILRQIDPQVRARVLTASVFLSPLPSCRRIDPQARAPAVR